jgi:hypothetical protein
VRTSSNQGRENGPAGCERALFAAFLWRGRTLEDAFIALTGHSIREVDAAPIDRMRMMRRVWLGRR